MKTRPTLGARCASILRRHHLKPVGLTYAETARVIDRANRNNR